METVGRCIRFYMHSEYYHEGKPLNQWLLDKAKSLEIPGGSGFQAQRGFGRRGVMHEEHFVGHPMDFAPVVVEFFVTAEQAGQLRALVAATGIEVFVAEWAAQFEQLSRH